MKILLPFLLFAGIFVGTSLISEKGTFTKYHNDIEDQVLSSSNPPTGKTGAPSEGNCTDCHSGTTQSASGVITYTYSGASNQYLPDSTYDISLSIASGPKNGFQMTILDGSNNAAGSFTAGTNSGTASSGGREYIRQTSSTGVTSWSFQWTAPSFDMGNLTVYYAFNQSNESGNNSGDVVYLGQETIIVNPIAGLTDYQEMENSFDAYFDDLNREIVLNYQPYQQADVTLSIQDLSGRLVYRENMGSKAAVSQQDRIDVGSFNKTGVYIVSVFVDNYVLNKKLFVH